MSKLILSLLLCFTCYADAQGSVAKAGFVPVAVPEALASSAPINAETQVNIGEGYGLATRVLPTHRKTSPAVSAPHYLTARTVQDGREKCKAYGKVWATYMFLVTPACPLPYYVVMCTYNRPRVT